MAQASAHLGVESALDEAGAAAVLPDWPERRRADLVRADLAELGAELPRPAAAPEFRNEAQLLGGIYVLEGSRLGGSVLSSRIAAGAPARFLRADAKPGAWRNLLILLADRLKGDPDLEMAAAAARACFACFEQAALLELEPVIA